MLRYLRLAIGFLTTLPVKMDWEHQSGDLGRAAGWFPLVGALLGGMLFVLALGLRALFTPLLAGALVVAAWAALTGGLHLDGLADSCDGLFAAASPERRLEIMDDPRLGTFGGAGLALFLLLKVLAIGLVRPAPADYLPLLLAPALARWLVLPLSMRPAARPGGLGAELGLGFEKKTLFWSALPVVVLILLNGPRAWVAVLLAGLVVFGLGRLARARLGGMTGDVLGFSIEISELVVLLTFAAQVQRPLWF